MLEHQFAQEAKMKGVIRQFFVYMYKLLAQLNG